MRKKTGVPIWEPSEEDITQTCHFSLAGCIVLSAHSLFGLTPWVSLACVFLWSVPKEFVVDIIIEKDTWADSWLDFSWYTIGGIFFFAAILRSF